MDNEAMHDGDQTATKGDIRALRDELKGFVRDELKGFATKDDLKAFATKEDLQAFPTRDDPKGFATKDDLRTFALAVDGSFRELNSKFDRVLETLTGTRSDVMAACERALTSAQKVDNDQLFTRYRLDRLEDRVAVLETRRKRRAS